MIILGFDCAIKNLGICCIEINDNWREEVAEIIDELNRFYSTMDQYADKSKFLSKIEEIFTRIVKLLDSMFQIRFLNIIDLIPGKKVLTVKYKDILKSLKYTLYCLNKQLPKPDKVLIENQMNINDKARGISRYIEEFYTDISDVDVSITYAIDAYPILAIKPVKTKPCDVVIVAPTLKNGYKTDPSELGDYSTYIEKYSNYTANKKHTTWNFKYFMEVFGKKQEIQSINNKLDDISDAFMMTYAWCKYKQLI